MVIYNNSELVKRQTVKQQNITVCTNRLTPNNRQQLYRILKMDAI